MKGADGSEAGGFQLLECELDLLDRAIKLLGGSAKLQSAQLRNLKLQARAATSPARASFLGCRHGAACWRATREGDDLAVECLANACAKDPVLRGGYGVWLTDRVPAEFLRQIVT
jgi:hypothetical protein